jgi:hypothetical protein
VKIILPAEIHRHLIEAYWAGIMNAGNVLNDAGRADVHNEDRAGLLPVITEDLKVRVDAS